MQRDKPTMSGERRCFDLEKCRFQSLSEQLDLGGKCGPFAGHHDHLGGVEVAGDAVDMGQVSDGLGGNGVYRGIGQVLHVAGKYRGVVEAELSDRQLQKSCAASATFGKDNGALGQECGDHDARQAGARAEVENGVRSRVGCREDRGVDLGVGHQAVDIGQGRSRHEVERAVVTLQQLGVLFERVSRRLFHVKHCWS